jgi:hypothetical protein
MPAVKVDDPLPQASSASRRCALVPQCCRPFPEFVVKNQRFVVLEPLRVRFGNVGHCLGLIYGESHIVTCRN